MIQNIISKLTPILLQGLQVKAMQFILKQDIIMQIASRMSVFLLVGRSRKQAQLSSR